MCHIIYMTHTKTFEQFHINVGERGRLVLPAKIRKRLALKNGDHMVLSVDSNGRMVLMPLKERIQKLRGLLCDAVSKQSLADSLIQERREEAAKENRSK